MKARVVEVRRNRAEGTVAPGACPECRGDVRVGSHELWAGQRRAVRCECGAELAVEVQCERAVVARPYGADFWVDVKSSNLAAVGRKGRNLLIRFKAPEAVYLYRDAGGEFDALVGAPSVGKQFHATVRRIPAERLCAVYACPRLAVGPTRRCERHEVPKA